jgi:hypothetical protein
MKEKVISKNEQLTWLSLKSIGIGKEFMVLVKQRDEMQQIIERANSRITKLKEKNVKLE